MRLLLALSIVFCCTPVFAYIDDGYSLRSEMDQSTLEAMKQNDDMIQQRYEMQQMRETQELNQLRIQEQIEEIKQDEEGGR